METTYTFEMNGAIITLAPGYQLSGMYAAGGGEVRFIDVAGNRALIVANRTSAPDYWYQLDRLAADLICDMQSI